MTRFFVVLFLVAAVLPGCGGGTSGSGLKTYDGRVASVQGQALSGVNVTIETTGDASITDAEGAFAIKSDAYGQEVPFLLESPNFRNRFVLEDIPESSSRITVDVTVNTETDAIAVSNIRVRAWFAGFCDYYFENREIIRQANKLPNGTVCSLNVEVLGDGRRLEDVPVSLQYSGCKPNSIWETLQTVQTGAGPHAGSAEINFEFIDSDIYCRYRVLVPVRTGRSPFAAYPIDTFTEQEYYRK